MRLRSLGWIGVLGGLALVLGLATTPRESLAGTFIYAGEVEGVDVITHPPGYSSSHSGPLQVDVCVASSAPRNKQSMFLLQTAPSSMGEGIAGVMPRLMSWAKRMIWDALA